MPEAQLFASATLKQDQDKTISYPQLNETKNGSIFNGKRSFLTFRDGMFR